MCRRGLALLWHCPLITGINITDEQIAQMEANIMNIDFEKAEKKETETRHDVMAHVYTFGEVCPAVRRYTRVQNLREAK